MAPLGTDFMAERASACRQGQLVRGPNSDGSKVGGGSLHPPGTCEALLKIHFREGGHSTSMAGCFCLQLACTATSASPHSASVTGNSHPIKRNSKMASVIPPERAAGGISAPLC